MAIDLMAGGFPGEAWAARSAEIRQRYSEGPGRTGPYVL